MVVVLFSGSHFIVGMRMLKVDSTYDPHIGQGLDRSIHGRLVQ
jgi:hypothetical protein